MNLNNENNDFKEWMNCNTWKDSVFKTSGSPKKGKKTMPLLNKNSMSAKAIQIIAGFLSLILINCAVFLFVISYAINVAVYSGIIMVLFYSINALFATKITFDSALLIGGSITLIVTILHYRKIKQTVYSNNNK